ncbi:MAG TPA: alpha/beta fold hydrolase [Burkholderiaceae bacterium]|nr:alpha/beta fold hydrolase [Burkholderiaceae bacterium]
MFRVVLIIAAVYCLLLGVLYVAQEALMFFPTRLPPQHRFELPDVEEVTIKVDGATLSALHFKQPNAKGVVYFLHGNAGSLREWFTDTSLYRRAGFDLFMLDYRGYGKSSGRIRSEAQLHGDVRAAWDFIAPQYVGRKVVLYGRSLGSGPAARLATEIDAALLVLVSPYLSLRQLATEVYPFVPGLLVRYPLRTDQWIARTKAPVLIVHGEEDALIPVAHAHGLSALRPDAQLLTVRGAGHNDVHLFPDYTATLLAALRRL